MKVFLMYPEKDFDQEMKLPENSKALIKDLELNTLLKAMANEDDLIKDVVQKNNT